MGVYTRGMDKKHVYETLPKEMGRREIESVREMIEMSGNNSNIWNLKFKGYRYGYKTPDLVIH